MTIYGDGVNLFTLWNFNLVRISLIRVTNSQENMYQKRVVGYTRNLHRTERCSIRHKFLVPETFKHSRPYRTTLVTCTGASFRYVSCASFLSVCQPY